MAERLIVTITVFGIVIGADLANLKKAQRSERVAYIGLLAAALYLSVEFVTGLNLPNLNELMDATLTEPAKRIVDYLKVAD